MSSKECTPGVQELLLQFNLEQYNHKLAECGYSSCRNLSNIPSDYKEEAVSNVFGICDISDKIKMLTIINTIQNNTSNHNGTLPMDLPPMIHFSAAIDLTRDGKRKFSELDMDVFLDSQPSPKRQKVVKNEPSVIEQIQNESEDESTQNDDETTQSDDDDEMTESDDAYDDEETESEDPNDRVEDEEEDVSDKDTESDTEDEEDEEDDLDWDKIEQHDLKITSELTSKWAPKKWEKWEFDYIHKTIKKQLKHNPKVNWTKICCQLALKTKRKLGGRPWRTWRAVECKAKRDLRRLLRLKPKRKTKKKPHVLQETQATDSDSATASFDNASATESCRDTLEAVDLDHSDHTSAGEIENDSNTCDDIGNLSEISTDPLDKKPASSTESHTDTIHTMDLDHVECTNAREIENASNTCDDNLNVIGPLEDEGETTEEETVSITNNASGMTVNKETNQNENENEIISGVTTHVSAKDATMQDANDNLNTNDQEITDTKPRRVPMRHEFDTNNVDINKTQDNDIKYKHKLSILWPETLLPKGREEIHKRLHKKHKKFMKRYIAMRKRKGYSFPTSISCIFCGTYELLT
eukprot:541563_1